MAIKMIKGILVGLWFAAHLHAAPYSEQAVKNVLSSMTETPKMEKKFQKSLFRYNQIFAVGHKTSHSLNIETDVGSDYYSNAALEAAATAAKSLQKSGKHLVLVGYNNGNKARAAVLKASFSAIQISRELYARGVRSMEMVGVQAHDQKTDVVELWYIDPRTVSELWLAPAPHFQPDSL